MAASNCPRSRHGVTQVVVGLGVVGLDFQRLLIMGDGRVDLSALRHGNAEVIVGLGVVGLDFQRLLIMGDGRIDLSASRQDVTEAVCGLISGLSAVQRQGAWVQSVSLFRQYADVCCMRQYTNHHAESEAPPAPKPRRTPSDDAARKRRVAQPPGQRTDTARSGADRCSGRPSTVTHLHQIRSPARASPDTRTSRQTDRETGVAIPGPPSRCPVNARVDATTFQSGKPLLEWDKSPASPAG